MCQLTHGSHKSAGVPRCVLVGDLVGLGTDTLNPVVAERPGAAVEGAVMGASSTGEVEAAGDGGKEAAWPCEVKAVADKAAGDAGKAGALPCDDGCIGQRSSQR